jgi:hypothetical protein
MDETAMTETLEQEHNAKILRRLGAASVASSALVFLVMYATAVGHGFISDDFGWIAQSQIRSWLDVERIFVRSSGFYRPLVSISFAANYALFGLEPFGYGLTNLLIALTCAFLVYQIARALELGSASWLAAAVWLFNFHGINMALLWISGRTSLLVTMFALAGALAVLRRRVAIALGALALALLSKEEAVMLPAVYATWAIRLQCHRTPDERRRLALLLVGAGCLLAAYWLARNAAGAVTPATAPWYYRFTTDPGAILRNVLEYFDRAATLCILIGLLFWSLLRKPVRVRRSTWVLGLSWYVGGYAVTTFLPVRSSLYACLPSVGPALILAEFASVVWERLDVSGRRRALLVAIVLPILLTPIYMMRNRKWTDLAGYSQSVLTGLSADLQELPPDSWIVLVDRDRESRVNVESAFGTLIGDAVSLRAGKRLQVWIEPPLSMAGIAGMHPPCDTCVALRRTVVNGRIQP